VFKEIKFIYLFITVSHGGAYTVVSATQQVNRKGQFLGVRTLQLLNRLTKNLTHVITLVSWPRMPNFIKFSGTRASRQYGEMCTPRTFLIFFYGRFLRKLYRKKYSTVSSA